MEYKNTQGIPIKIYSDSVSGFSFLYVLTDSTLMHIKLRTSFDRCPFRHMIRPHYLVEFELVKRSSRWVCVGVAQFQECFLLPHYTSHQILADIYTCINAHTYENQDTSGVLSAFQAYMKNHPIDTITIQDFESHLLMWLGFHSRSSKTHISKQSNHLTE